MKNQKRTLYTNSNFPEGFYFKKIRQRVKEYDPEISKYECYFYTKGVGYQRKSLHDGIYFKATMTATQHKIKL